MGNVANVMFDFSQIVIAPKDPNYTQVHPRLLRYAPYFDGCIGALDGTHIPARINHDSRLDFINRKGRTSFNVLGIVDMDMRFTYVWTGRAGSCHDMAVLRDCIWQITHIHQQGDTIWLILVTHFVKDTWGPYRSTRYHLEEFRRRGAETKEEKFNYHHASLRNVVERAFDVLKAKWHILEAVPFYARKKQTKMIIACCALQNFLLDRHLARQPEPVMPGTVDAA
ncbi:LOW QUALITY PROTEIN: hypothetical protein U9M48_026317, partial [Paspalum notatum var. saurae]